MTDQLAIVVVAGAPLVIIVAMSAAAVAVAHLRRATTRGRRDD